IDRDEGLGDQGSVEVARRELEHIVPELFAEPGGRLDRANAVRVDWHIRHRRARYGDAKPSGIGANLLCIRPRPGRRPVRVADVRALGGVEQRGAVTHAPRQRVLTAKPGWGFAQAGPKRVPGPSRLQPEEAAAGGRDTDRAPAVVAVAHGHHT